MIHDEISQIAQVSCQDLKTILSLDDKIHMRLSCLRDCLAVDLSRQQRKLRRV